MLMVTFGAGASYDSSRDFPPPQPQASQANYGLPPAPPSTRGKMDDAQRMKQKLEPPDKDAWNNQMYKIRVFDNLVYDTDPNLTNVLIGEDWKLWRIDFSRAFRTFKDVKDPKDLVRCDRQFFEKLKALNATDLSEKTKGYLTKDEVKAVMARRDKIVERFQKLIAEKGEGEVLY
jgi:hypothetical protein